MEKVDVKNIPFDLEKVWKKIRMLSFKNKPFSKWSITITCIVIDKKTGKIILSKKNQPWDLRNKQSKKEHKWHAEHFVIYDLRKMKVDLNDCYYVITFEPCSSCYFNEFRKFNIDTDNIYLVSTKLANPDYRGDIVKYKILPPFNSRSYNTYSKVRQNLETFSKQEILWGNEWV